MQLTDENSSDEPFMMRSGECKSLFETNRSFFFLKFYDPF